MTNNETPTLVAYNTTADLTEIRLHPELYPRVEATERTAAITKMVPMVYAAILYSGRDISKDRILYMATALVDEIMADNRFGLRHLSWEEIGMTIRNAVLGGAREMYGISVATIYAALIDYARGEGHQAVLLANSRRKP